MLGHDPARQREAQANAARSLGEERLPQPLEVLGGQPDARIANGQQELAVSGGRLRRHGHRPARRHRLDRVAHQIHQGMVQQLPITDDPEGIRREMQPHGVTSRLRPSRGRLHDHLEQIL